MHKSPEPQPLTRLNVTKHDRIWDKEITKGFFGFDHSNSLFSPPLKHITPETAEELWEKFDPLDLLIDSASEKSVKSESSSDTMIMMTSEELKKNEERIKNSFKEFEHRKNLQTSQMNPATNYQPEENFAVQQTQYGNHPQDKTSEDDFLNDEGYGTDSRTNTTASLSSPLSSSLSSLLTSESSSSQGSLQRNLNGHQRPQQIPSNGRLVVGSRQNVVAKKKVPVVEKTDNSLMEKLRALTTIEEEETGGDSGANSQQAGREEAHRYTDYSSERVRDGPRHELQGSDPRCVGDRCGEGRGGEGEGGRNMFMEEGRVGCDGIFRAVPVKIRQRNSVSQMENIPVQRMDMSRHSDKLNPESRYWNGGAPPPDSRQSSGDVSNSVPGSMPVPPKLSKQPGYMYSMPNLAGDPRSGTQMDQVVMRRPKLGSQMHRVAPKPDHRFSWDCSSDVRSKFDVNSHNFAHNAPNKCDDPPKLSNQFRASSEMALQNGRPLFATSSDIYKLFQGQGRTGFSQGKQSSHRHSFHAMPSQTFSVQNSDPSTEELRNRLRAASTQQSSAPARVKVGPVRANHQVYKYSQGSTNEMSHQPSYKQRPSSLAEGKDKLSTLV